MNLSTAADLLLIAAAVVWVLAKQVRVARVKPRLLLLAPLVLAYFGIRGLPASTWHVPADLGLLAASAVLSLALGAWRGQTIQVWRDAGGTWWRRGSALTLVLWGVLIVARGLLYGVSVAVGHREASNLGAVLLALALSFTAQRMGTAQPLTGGQPAVPVGGDMVLRPRLAAHDRIRDRRHERIQARRQERRGRREDRRFG